MRPATIIAASLLLTGCAARPGPAPVGESTPPGRGRLAAPSPEFTRSVRAIEIAKQQGADTDRMASMHLFVARSELQQAERRLAIGDRETARGLLMRAEVDAEMSALIVREAALRDAARKAVDEANTLSESPR